MKPRKIKLLLFTGQLFFLVIALCFMIIVKPAFAEMMKSNSFEIQFGNFNVTSGEKDSAHYNVTDTVGQTAAGPFGAYGSSSYFVGAGFQYIYQIGQFAFSISDIDINLGELSAGQHNSDTNTLTIYTKGASGYSIYAYESHPLRHSNGIANIADTTCDNTLCSQTTAAVWTDQSIPGFGFNINGDGTPVDFINSTYFRQFADQSSAENAQVVMSSTNIAKGDQATVTYKAGISGYQAAGNYQTQIIYIAVPGF
jgi:hypothetical protein